MAGVQCRARHDRGLGLSVDYKFKLTSNFTYFLDDPVNGDEFKQVDRRQLHRGALAHGRDLELGSMPLRLTTGGDTRYDDIGPVGLYQSVGGVTVATVRQDKVREFSIGAYGEAALSITPRLRKVLGIQYDHYGFGVRSTTGANSGTGTGGILSPKLTLAWRIAEPVEPYAKDASGFHSNDARGAAISVDPNTLAAVDPVNLLVTARGAELGARLQRRRFNATLVAFWLKLDSELLFAGDGGTTEPNPASHRFGTEFAGFFRPFEAITIDVSAAYTQARFTGVAGDASRIPNAVPVVVAAGATWDAEHAFRPAPVCVISAARH